ncbi:glycoside hydrolase family 2 TIM barrel-domain containing protein [Paenarthrobacter sp. NPDC058040]|uniref:glycoside hydrolase family 2 TIM barrel-domain containing protein n=1 Tax=unclassified Paenarthrobacter TaxID=2634190 RepID=UPI0036D81E14
MIRRSFNDNWTVAPKKTPFDSFTGGADALPVTPLPVTLPHDAVRDLQRSPDHPGGSHTGYFPGGYFRYEKVFDVPAEHREKVVAVEFEGVYRDAMVYINGDLAAQRPNGYAGFVVDANPYLRFGQPNTIAVECRSHQDSRWYTGAGIYRDTHLAVSDPIHIPLDGVQVSTEYVEGLRAVLAVAVLVTNETRATRTVRVETTVTDADGAVVAAGSSPITLLPNTSGVARFRLNVDEARLWSTELPNLYANHSAVRDGDVQLDEDRTVFGIREVRVDAVGGLRINGEQVKLRGACVHHDNGPLGSAAIARAEERRIEILKASGFNAIRSSHNPTSKAMLDACDRLGVLVMDELTDVWTVAKTGFDSSLSFPEWWERDIEAMVRKDFNHPSVICYSIGNEIFETGSSIGSTWGRKLVEKLRILDTTRFVTNAINPTVSVFDTIAAMMSAAGQQQDVNTAMGSMGDGLAQLVVSDLVTGAIEEAAAQVDVVGLNYGDQRYEQDAELFPQRVLVGSETNPGHIDDLWRLVTKHDHVIGDFTWVGWDYLGESGIGRVDYTDEPGYKNSGLSAAYPYLVAFAGDIDITGHRRPMSYYRETVFGLAAAPYIAVHRPQNYGRSTASSGWAWSDSVSSWTWAVPAGSPVVVDVYSSCDEVELIINDEVIARHRVGAEKAFIARFDTHYRAGELTAIAYHDGVEQNRTTVVTADGPVAIDVRADKDTVRADDTDLAYVEISLRDRHGTVVNNADRAITVTVTGAGSLAGLGTGRPSTQERFDAATCTTFDGRALAIIRPHSPGKIDIQVEADGCPPASASIEAEELIHTSRRIA